MEENKEIKYIVMLSVLIFITPNGGKSDLENFLGLILYLLLVALIILVSSLKLNFISGTLHDESVDKLIWLSVFITGVILVFLKIISLL